MSRHITLAFALIMALSLAACAGPVGVTDGGASVAPPPSPSEPEETPVPPEPTADGIVWLNPDGREFARGFGDVWDENSGLGVVQYWDTGEKTVKFERKGVGFEELRFRINGYTTSVDYNHGLAFVYVADEFIVVVTHGTDIRAYSLYILDHAGEDLLKVYWLNNKGMVIGNAFVIDVDDERITVHGSRWYHDLALVMGNPYDPLPEYADYWYIDTVYDYDFELSRWLELDLRDPENVERVNPAEIVEAEFVIEYLGGGKFSGIQMTDDFTTFCEWMEWFLEWQGGFDD
jgi:hypothetical protein